MPKITLGNHISGRLIPLTQQTLSFGESVPGEIYELLLETNGIPNPEDAVNLLTQEFPNFDPSTKILWIEADNQNIRMQISGSPFLWTALIPWLPSILGLLGITLAFISIWNLITSIPTWIWALLAVSVGLIIFAPAIGKMFPAEEEVEPWSY